MKSKRKGKKKKSKEVREREGHRIDETLDIITERRQNGKMRGEREKKKR